MNTRLVWASVAALAFIATWEGVKTKPYLDVGGIPTVCAGHTGDDVEDREYSPQECADMLRADAIKHGQAMMECVTVPLSQKTYDALLSFTYNVGVSAFCNSTLVEKLNAGDYEGACNQLPRWNKAGGKVMRGLIRRREAERKLCLGGL